MSGGGGDFVVVGGGIAGLMTALEILRRGHSATVADAGYPPASAAGAGILSALPPWRCAPPVAALISENNKRIGALVHEIETSAGADSDCEWRRPGMLALADSPPSPAPAGSTITPVRWLAPLLAAERAYGIWMPEVGQVRAAKLAAHLRRMLQKTGARFAHGKARLEYSQNKITAARMQNGDKLAADHYIICAGARGGEVCPPPSPPVAPVRGQLLLYRTPKPLMCIVFSCAEELYLSPRGDEMILAGASFEDAGFDDRPAAAVQRELHRKAAALFPPLREAQTLDSWSGLRPCLPDAMPCIGAHPRYENLYLNVGHGRYGVATAHAAARHLLKIMRAPETENPFAFREWDADASGEC
ncbi:MAG: NAD(P)/FAD-dependent oxidoreductase [Gammaproteobacteria bacterium]